MADPYLLLWLEAPMQSWGYDSRFGRRDSLDFPTKSGVLGLVCCALGAGGEQCELLARFADLDMQVQGYVPPKKHYNQEQPQKTDRQPLLRDFHMVGSGYDDKDPIQNLHIPKKADGSKAVRGGSKMTYRYYLQDLAFGVALQTPGDMARELGHRLLNPVWDLYLGRKCCAPTDIIYRGGYATAAEAMTESDRIAGEKNLACDFLVVNGEFEGDEVLTLNDIPVRFGQDKIYRSRRVTVFRRCPSD